MQHPFPSHWNDVTGGLEESQDFHYCPAVTRPLATLWCQWGPHAGQYWGTPTSPSKRGTSAGLVESWNSYPCPAEMRNTSPHQVSTELSEKSGFLPLLGCNEAAPSLPLTEQCQRKPAKTEGFNKIQSLIIPNHTRFKYKKITCHAKTHEDHKLNGKGQSIDTNIQMTEMSEWSDKDVKTAI